MTIKLIVSCVTQFIQLKLIGSHVNHLPNAINPLFLSKHLCPFPSNNRRQGQLAACLPSQNLGDRVSDTDTGLFNFLLRETSGDANLKRRLKFPFTLFGGTIRRHRHALQASDQNTVYQSLDMLVVSYSLWMIEIYLIYAFL